VTVERVQVVSPRVRISLMSAGRTKPGPARSLWSLIMRTSSEITRAMSPSVIEESALKELRNWSYRATSNWPSAPMNMRRVLM
jgi:hypothetical protein